MARLRVAVVGVGHLGKEHARILATMPQVELAGVADVNTEQARAVAGRCGTNAFTDHRQLLSRVDAAVIAVPTAHHHAVAADFLSCGIPLLVEKPLAVTLEQADALVQLARVNGTIIQVGHIERFNPAFQELRRRPLQPKFITCERLGPFSGRSTDIGVVLDLMIHDLDLLLDLVGAPVDSVHAVGLALLGGHEDVANARLTFANGCVADVTASRVSPQPKRSMHVWAAEGYAALDFRERRLRLIQPSPELRDRKLDVRRLGPPAMALLKEQLFGRHLQVLELHRPEGDQLTLELGHFVNCVRSGSTPCVSGEAGQAALELAGRVVAALQSHSWDGAAQNGPAGPCRPPAPHGTLFQAPPDQAAA
jgi:predicted dehydrogenase